MSSTYSTNLALELIGTGEQAGTWGATTNSNLGTLVEQAISGYVTQVVATGIDTTITIPNGSTGVARNMYIELTGTGGTGTNLIVPANKKLYFIYNNASGAVTVKVAAQTGVSVPAGKKMGLVCNGTDIVSAVDYFATFDTASFSASTITSTGTATFATSSGNVGVGTGSPSVMLDVVGTASKQPILKLQAGSGATGGFKRSILKLRDDTGSAGYDVVGLGDGANALTFDSVSGGTATTRMTLDSSGNVGVGTGSPGYKLDVSTAGTAIARFSGPANGYADVTDGTGTLRMQLLSNVPHVGSYSNHALNLITNNTVRATIDSSGNVGIGTTSPEALLTVSKATAGGEGGYIYLDNPTAAAGGANKAGIKFGTSSGASFATTPTGEITNLQTDTGTGAAALTFGTFNGTSSGERMRLDANGNLGIGVTPSAWGATYPGRIEGLGWAIATPLDGGTDTSAFATNAYNTTGSTWVYRNSASATLYQQFSGSHRFYVAASGTAGNPITFTQAMTLDSSGNLGIGTTSPGSKLTVVGTVSLTASGQVQSNNGASGCYTTWQYNATSVGDIGSGNQAFSGGGTSDFGITSRAGNLVLGTGSTERARIDSSGNLGIGTASPSGKLHVTAGTSQKGIFITQASTTPAIYMTNGSGSAYMQTGGAQTSIGTDGAWNLSLETNSTSRMLIDSGGNVGIGTSSPNYKVDISGGSLRLSNAQWVYFNSSTGNARAVLGYSGGNDVILDSVDGDLLLRTATNVRMQINASGNYDFKAGTVTTNNSSASEVGYKGMPLGNSGSHLSSGTYTAVLADAGKSFYSSGATGFTIPANSSVAYPIGTVMTLVNSSGGNMTISITSDTLTAAVSGSTGSRTLANYGIATMIKTNTTSWFISGAGLT